MLIGRRKETDMERLQREIRWLKAWAAISTLALTVLLWGAFRSRQTSHMTVLDVERINIVEPDGSLALVISNADRIPGPVVEGKELARELSSGRTGSAGMIFFNARGDEVGGLTFRGREADGTYSAGGILAFDQFRQDQVVAVQYSDRGTSRSAGISVWDRSTDMTIGELVELVTASRGAPGPARDSALQRLQRLQNSGGLGGSRIFLGSQDRTAALRINDTSGRVRIRLYVDSADVARLEFLNERGEVVQTLPGTGSGLP
jgi:hypothetical protein